MTRRLASIIALLFLSACSAPAEPQDGSVMHDPDDHSMHSEAPSSSASSSRLTDSPRHQEWVEVKNGDRTVYTWVVYPQVSENAPVVVLIHENRGLNDWARSMADQVAEAGFIAVAPDLLSGFSEQFDRTSDFPDEDASRNAIAELKPEQVSADLRAVVSWAKTVPAGNGRIASAGFCWGGSQSFNLAAVSNDLDAALVFYGTGPQSAETYAEIDVPVYGFYGGADQRVNATIEASEQHMKTAGKTYEPVTYEGAGHAFMRLGEADDADPANATARSEAWRRMTEILSQLK